MGHELGNCCEAKSQKRVPSSSRATQEWVKLKTPVSQGHGYRGAGKVDPQSTSIPAAKFEEILQTLTNNAVSFETKQRILNKAVSRCPSISIEILGQ